MFMPKSVERTTFCSRECSFAHKAASPSCVVHAAYCLGCGKPFVSRRKRAYCADACWQVAEYVSTAPSQRACAACGETFIAPKAKTRPTDFCSAVCKQAAEARHRRIAKSRRRAVLRSARVEVVDPFYVFNRDRWTCRLCGVKTPRSKRGSYEDVAPELDHIIPLSQGGEHSYRNTQCACRKCNAAKSDRPMGQLLMF